MKTIDLNLQVSKGGFISQIAYNVYAWCSANHSFLQPLIAYRKRGYRVFLSGPPCYFIGVNGTPEMPPYSCVQFFLLRTDFSIGGTHEYVCSNYNCVSQGYGKFTYRYEGQKFAGRPIGGLWWKSLPAEYSTLPHTYENFNYLQYFYHGAVTVELFCKNPLGYGDPHGLAEIAYTKNKLELLPHRQDFSGMSAGALKFILDEVKRWKEFGMKPGKRLNRVLRNLESISGGFIVANESSDTGADVQPRKIPFNPMKPITKV